MNVLPVQTLQAGLMTRLQRITVSKWFLILGVVSQCLIFSSVAQAKVETYEFATPQIEEDYKTLVAELRCLVCQNQNLADSNAELAVDMRAKVYKMLNEGSDKEEIVEYMVARYGDFVMYRPPVKSSTFLLWFGPLIFFVIAARVVVPYIRRSKSTAAKTAIDATQQKKAHSLLDDEK